jgi:hypothetical protein
VDLPVFKSFFVINVQWPISLWWYFNVLCISTCIQSRASIWADEVLETEDLICKKIDMESKLTTGRSWKLEKAIYPQYLFEMQEQRFHAPKMKNRFWFSWRTLSTLDCCLEQMEYSLVIIFL